MLRLLCVFSLLLIVNSGVAQQTSSSSSESSSWSEEKTSNLENVEILTKENFEKEVLGADSGIVFVRCTLP